MSDLQAALASYEFHPAVVMPTEYKVWDFSQETKLVHVPPRTWGVGRYNEIRPGMYTGQRFNGNRNVHMGIDLICAPGVAVHAVADSEILYATYRDNPLDYGATIITAMQFGDVELFALYGHLSLRSLEGKMPGQFFPKGEVLAWVGPETENGGWNPHLHLQLSVERPTEPDMPGVVYEKDREAALKRYPDPRLVLGPLY